MKKSICCHALACLLTAFFILGGTLNIFASPEVLSDYQNWGYPSWFHYVTGGAEWTAAILIALPTTRMLGSYLGGAIMGAATATLLFHSEFTHALAPLAVLAIVSLNAWFTRSQASEALEGR